MRLSSRLASKNTRTFTRRAPITQPFCNGTHKTAQTEESGKLYWYEEYGKRRDTADNYPGMRSDQQTKDA